MNVRTITGITMPPFLCRTWPESGETCSEETSTASKSEPLTCLSSLTSVSLNQLASGAPLMYQFEPMSARIRPDARAEIRVQAGSRAHALDVLR